MNEDTGYKWTKTDYCAVIFAIVLAGIGYLLSRFIEDSMSVIPEGFGPPTIFIWMPMIMCSVPLLICIYLMATADKRHRAKMEGPTIHRYRDDTIVYTGDYQLHAEPESKDSEKVYLIPTECPSCFKAINEESVQWVGPLKAKCPYCETIIEAKEKTF